MLYKHANVNQTALPSTTLVTHLAFLIYMIRHKWYVLQACRALGVPLHQALLHDCSKFTPQEWFPYVNRFRHVPPHRLAMGRVRCNYGNGDTTAFERARERHWQTNSHHWQYWCRRDTDGKLHPQPMPPHFVREMVADWIGASKAQGNSDMLSWYHANCEKIILHEQTSHLVDQVLAEAVAKGVAS